MDIKRLRLAATDDPAYLTAVEAAAAEADSAPEFEQVLRSHGWPVDVVESADPTSIGQPVVDVRQLDAAATSRS